MSGSEPSRTGRSTALVRTWPGTNLDHPERSPSTAGTRSAAAGTLQRMGRPGGGTGAVTWPRVDDLRPADEGAGDREVLPRREDADVGPPPGCERPAVGKAEPLGSRERGHPQGQLGLEPELDGAADAVVDQPVAADQVRVAVVGAEGAAGRRRRCHEGEEGLRGSARSSPRGGTGTCRGRAGRAPRRPWPPRGRSGPRRARRRSGRARRAPARGRPRSRTRRPSRRGRGRPRAARARSSPRPARPRPPAGREAASSAAPITAPPTSAGVAGTQDGSVRSRSMGRWGRHASMYSIPGTPSTFAISWGSATTVVVPWIAASLAYSNGESRDDSTWTWASISPGRPGPRRGRARAAPGIPRAQHPPAMNPERGLLPRAEERVEDGGVQEGEVDRLPRPSRRARGSRMARRPEDGQLPDDGAPPLLAVVEVEVAPVGPVGEVERVREPVRAGRQVDVPGLGDRPLAA